MEELTDKEFDLLDELYFVQNYSELKEALKWQDQDIQSLLKDLSAKGYVKLLSDHDTEYILPESNQKTPWNTLYFLATKKGLMVHNGF
jgi:hypothetical protein